MELHSDPHSGKEPTVISMTTHPTTLQTKDLFDQALHGFDGLPAFLLQTLGARPVQQANHRLPPHGMSAIAARRGQQGHAPLPAELKKQGLIIGLAVHYNGPHRAFEMPSFPPQSFGVVRTVPHRRECAQHHRAMRHQGKRAVPLYPSITLAVTPGGLPIQPTQTGGMSPGRWCF
jgi:hypothetical protein